MINILSKNFLVSISDLICKVYIHIGIELFELKCKVKQRVLSLEIRNTTLTFALLFLK